MLCCVPCGFHALQEEKIYSCEVSEIVQFKCRAILYQHTDQLIFLKKSKTLKSNTYFPPTQVNIMCLLNHFIAVSLFSSVLRP